MIARQVKTLPVIFRAERCGDHKDSVTAVFPTMAADYAGLEFTTYQHIGQHGAGNFAWYAGTRAARPDEYAGLLSELRGIYETSLSLYPEIYGEPVRLDVKRRITGAHRAALALDARQARAAARAESGAGLPWSPDARATAIAAIASDERESVS